jgi:hypothetical protein
MSSYKHSQLKPRKYRSSSDVVLHPALLEAVDVIFGPAVPSPDFSFIPPPPPADLTQEEHELHAAVELFTQEITCSGWVSPRAPPEPAQTCHWGEREEYEEYSHLPTEVPVDTLRLCANKYTAPQVRGIKRTQVRSRPRGAWRAPRQPLEKGGGYAFEVASDYTRSARAYVSHKERRASTLPAPEKAEEEAPRGREQWWGTQTWDKSSRRSGGRWDTGDKWSHDWYSYDRPDWHEPAPPQPPQTQIPQPQVDDELWVSCTFRPR